MTELERLVKSLVTKVDKIMNVIIGDPTDESKPGVMIRLDRLEQSNKIKSRVMWVLATGLMLAAANSLITLL